MCIYIYIYIYIYIFICVYIYIRIHTIHPCTMYNVHYPEDQLVYMYVVV